MTDQAKVISVACGSQHSMALVSTPEGTIVLSWGRAEDGQLGHGDAEERLRPHAVFSLINRGVSSVHCGAEYSLAVAHDRHEIYSCGWGDFGRLGVGDCLDYFLFEPIPSFTGRTVISVSCGDTHTLFATKEGELFACGRNSNGQLGTKQKEDSLIPLPVEDLAGKHVTCVAAGAEHSVCATADGEVFGWGWNRYGCIGDGDIKDRHSPVKVQGLEGVHVTRVACGWRHTLAVDENGTLYSWGWSKYGQLGHGDQIDQLLPKRLEALADRKIAIVAGGWRHTLATDNAGRVFSWGWNKFGQLGLGHNDDACAPQPVETLATENVVKLATGWKHTLVVTETGKFFAWGRGSAGQLGQGEMQDSNVPIQLEELSAGAISVEALMKAAHPVVMHSILPGDRYAVVPDNAAADGGGSVVPDQVPSAEVPGGASKRQKF